MKVQYYGKASIRDTTYLSRRMYTKFHIFTSVISHASLVLLYIMYNKTQHGATPHNLHAKNHKLRRCLYYIAVSQAVQYSLLVIVKLALRKVGMPRHGKNSTIVQAYLGDVLDLLSCGYLSRYQQPEQTLRQGLLATRGRWQ